MSRHIPALLLCASGLVGLVGLEKAALAADPQEQRLAQALFDDARRLMEGGQYGDACPKLAESQRLDPGGGTILNLAICHEKEGKLATARNDFDEALAVATKDGRKDRQKIAKDRLAAIAGAIPRVTVVVAPSADIEGLEVKLDGLVLRRAAWGVEATVDPGSHVVEASATGRSPWSSNVQINAGQKKVVPVPTLGPLASLPPGGSLPLVMTADLPSPLGAGEPPAAEQETAPARYSEKANPAFYAVLAATLASAATSAVTGIMTLSASSDASAGCLPDRKYCRDAASADAADRAKTLAWVSTITLGVAAAGVVALLVIPSRVTGTKSSVRSSAMLLPGGGAFGLSGSF